MGARDDGTGPVVEASPNGESPDPVTMALDHRIHQQEILADLGVAALQGASLDDLLAEAARLVALGMRTRFCKVLEHQPAENCLLVRAGVGWHDGVVGVVRIGADLESPAGFALQTGKPVISNHLENEERFRTPSILLAHGIRRAMNVIVQGDGRPFGVLEVDARGEDEFDERDIAFLQGAANLLGMAIERDRRERDLNTALERHRFLLAEMNHRVKNSLAIIASMLRLQSGAVADATLTGHLDDAARRVTAVARAHDQLSHGSEIVSMDLGRYVEAIGRDLEGSLANCQVHVSADHGIEVPTDRAITTALIVNELVANAAKYGYGDRAGGPIWITVERVDGDRVAIAVRDAGAGLPAGFDPATAKGLGMRIVSAFARQLGGDLGVEAYDRGTAFRITVPRLPAG